MSSAIIPTLNAHLVVDVVVYYLVFRLFKWLSSPYLFPHFRHIPGPPSESWFKGNLGQLFNAKGLPFHQQLIDRFGGMVKVYGFFGDEQLYISDPHALQSIILKDQDSFEETAVFIDTNKIIFGPGKLIFFAFRQISCPSNGREPGLVATTGDVHKKQRKMVTPVFSIPQLKRLTPVVYDIAEKLADVLTRESKASSSATGSTTGGVLDMSEWVSRVALETIGQTVLGYSFDPLDSPHNNPYTSAIKELIPTLFSLSVIRQFAPFLSRLGTAGFRRKLVEWTPNRAVQRVKDMSDIMDRTARSILREKQKVLSESDVLQEDVEEKDIISVLLRANEKAAAGEKLSESELHGSNDDTTSSALSRILYLLSAHPDIQEKVHEEITTAFADADRLEYEAISELPWLDAIIKETLRLYPPVPFVRRTVTKERSLMYSTMNSDVADASVTVPAGTTLFVGIAGANRLESVWGVDAKVWMPQRWISNKNPASIRLPGIYAGMLSFLGGARSCIGYKFAQIEMKIILATLLRRFKFSPTKDEVIWNLSQIISPSVRRLDEGGFVEEKGLPLVVELRAD
ncbi:cytochrome P450 [Gymnopus androsaceus JB14]|uniref:Cytochrome P450 n=1 Tax=Gymnopus androsaceus JB14 TaxID=1447944 RepID=A0A6A4H7Z4_9AGAR|nr:cytochrome P450 [Gymnopus androsaceus JB14]